MGMIWFIESVLKNHQEPRSKLSKVLMNWMKRESSFPEFQIWSHFPTPIVHISRRVIPYNKPNPLGFHGLKWFFDPSSYKREKVRPKSTADVETHCISTLSRVPYHRTKDSGNLSWRFCNMFSESSPWQLQNSPTSWETLRNHVTTPSETVAALGCSNFSYLASKLHTENFLS